MHLLRVFMIQLPFYNKKARTAFGEHHVGELECTEGHMVEDRRYIETKSGEFDMLYGELLPEGVSHGLSRLNAMRSGTVLELGMGTGKVAFQVFFQCEKAERVARKQSEK